MKSYIYRYGSALGVTSAEMIWKMFGIDQSSLNTLEGNKSKMLRKFKGICVWVAVA
jgi:hypothetical protein